jgi:hypothetical protein
MNLYADTATRVIAGVLLITALVACDSDETRMLCTRALTNLLLEPELHPTMVCITTDSTKQRCVGLLCVVAFTIALAHSVILLTLQCCLRMQCMECNTL